MLGTTAGGLYWMFRYLERSENTSRLLEAGLRLALTHASTTDDDWESVLTTAGSIDAYRQRHDEISAEAAIDFVLRDETNPSSVLSVVTAGRNSARSVRTALTREVWEATNQCYLVTTALLAKPVPQADLPRVLSRIRQESTLVSGSLHATMTRNESFNFSRLGTLIERADNTARILDVKYYVLLPSASFVGSALDNVQWQNILRSVSAERAFRWAHKGATTPAKIAAFLILDERIPRSLAFCFDEIVGNLEALAADYGMSHPSHRLAAGLRNGCCDRTIQSIFDEGLHEFLGRCITQTNELGSQIETDYRFNA